MLDTTRPISIRRNSRSLDSQVPSKNPATPTPQPSATRAWPRRAITACAVARPGHVDRTRQGEHRQRATAQLGVVDGLDHERSDQERADGADHADGGDELHQLGETAAELGELTACGQSGRTAGSSAA